MFQKVGLLPESLGAMLTLEGLLSGMSSHVNFDVAFIKEATIAYLTMMHHLLAVNRTGATYS
jgi:hypothetical protein